MRPKRTDEELKGIRESLKTKDTWDLLLAFKQVDSLDYEGEKLVYEEFKRRLTA